MNPKDCMFRIYRDIRFSKDKSPYKTNFGTFIAKGGRKSMRPGYYFHIQPGESFAGGGVYMPAAEPLKAIRNYIAENPNEFLQITEDKEFKKFYPRLYDDQLKTAPMGFPKDHEFIHLLKYKSYVFSTHVSDNLLKGDNLLNYIVEAFRQLQRFNYFLNRAVDNFG